jgi:hypothetical protein
VPTILWIPVHSLTTAALARLLIGIALARLLMGIAPARLLMGIALEELLVRIALEGPLVRNALEGLLVPIALALEQMDRLGLQQSRPAREQSMLPLSPTKIPLV